MSIEYKLSEESAKEAIKQFLGFYDIDLDEAGMFLQLACGDLIKHVRTGRVEIVADIEKDSIKVVQNLKYKIDNLSKLEYGELHGSHKIQLGKNAKADNVTERQFVLLASLANENVLTFHKLRRGDVSVAETLGTIFLLL